MVRQSESLTPRSSDYLEFLDRGEKVYLPYGRRLPPARGGEGTMAFLRRAVAKLFRCKKRKKRDASIYPMF